MNFFRCIAGFGEIRGANIVVSYQCVQNCCVIWLVVSKDRCSPAFTAVSKKSHLLGYARLV